MPTASFTSSARGKRAHARTAVIWLFYDFHMSVGSVELGTAATCDYNQAIQRPRKTSDCHLQFCARMARIAKIRVAGGGRGSFHSSSIQEQIIPKRVSALSTGRLGELSRTYVMTVMRSLGLSFFAVSKPSAMLFDSPGS